MTSLRLRAIFAVLVTLQGVIITIYFLNSYSNLEKTLSYGEQYEKLLGEYLFRKLSTKIIEVSASRLNSEDDLPPKLFIAILSSVGFTKRRDAIRSTWMKDCLQTNRVKCKFFTDGLNAKGIPLQNSTITKLQQERRENKDDLVVLDTPSGRNFAIRLLAIMEWATNNVEFDFFLRMDDDHYLCLDRLVNELQFRPKRRLYWGHIHCVPGVVRIDEGWVMLTGDLVRKFIKTKSTLRCSRFADQALAMWIYDLMKRTPIIWYGDNRIFHHPPASTINDFKIRKEICHTYLSLHGSYPIEMRVFRFIHEHEKERRKTNYSVPPVIDTCPYQRQSFDWKWFDPHYLTEPIPCGKHPIWSDGGEFFLGRSTDIQNQKVQLRENDSKAHTYHVD